MSVVVKHGKEQHTIEAKTSVLASDLKVALEPLTSLNVAEMKLVLRGKKVADGDTVPLGTKLMLIKCQAARTTVKLHLREIITGRSRPGVEAPVSLPHDEVVELALKTLQVSTDGEACLRLFLPHVKTLMRVDLALSDYVTSATSNDDGLEIFLVPAMPGLRPDVGPSAEDIAAEHKAQQRMHELEMEMEATGYAMGTLLPPSIVESVAETSLLEALRQQQTEDTEDGAESLSSAGAAYGAAAKAEANEEGSETAPLRPPSHAPGPAAFAPRPPSPPAQPKSLVPHTIRTGLMPDLEEMAPVPSELLAELEAYEEYESEMRELARMPYAEARALMVATEEARLEERCVLLVETLKAPIGGGGLTLAQSLADLPSVQAGEPIAEAGSVWSEARPSVLEISSSAGRRARPGHSPATPRASSKCGWPALRGSSFTSSDYDGADSSLASSAEGFCHLVGECDDSGTSVADASPALVQIPAATAHKAAGARPRCKTCDLRLPLTARTAGCKCGGVFCSTHMHAHDCSFDYRGSEQRKLEKANPKCEPSKLERPL